MGRISLTKDELDEVIKSYYSGRARNALTRGDHGDFLQFLYEQYGREMYMFTTQRIHQAGTMMSNRDVSELAKDFCQDVFLKAYESLGKEAKGTPNINVRSWLRKIARNHVIDKLIKKPAPVRIENESSGYLNLSSTNKDPQAYVLNKELGKHLAACLDQLTEARRSAVKMVDVDGYTEPEASRELKIGIGALRKRLFDGRYQLRACMEPYVGTA